MAFTEGKQTQLGHGPYDPHPDKVDGGRPDDGVINSKEKQTDYMPIEEPPSPSHSEEINGPLNNSMPNKTSQMAVRIRSNEQPSFQQNVRQSGRGLRQSFYKRGGLPYIGENSEAVSSNRALGKPEMTERVSPADGEERPKKYPVATFARNSQIRNRPPNPVLTISRGPQPVILNLPSPVPGQT
nr:unnamed protein product [Spirometra erinaceieuropaei]